MIHYLGSMLHQLRKKERITQSRLVHGISNVPELSRIEHGTQLPDKMLMDALFQRLGKSSDKVEFILSEGEYELPLLKECVKSNLLDQRYAENRRLLSDYEKQQKKRRPLMDQYLREMEAVHDYIRGEEAGTCLKKMKAAIEITFSEWDTQGAFKAFFLCTQELQALMLIGYLLGESNEIKEAISIEKKIMRYIEARYTDEEEKVKIYPHCAFLLARNYHKLGQWEKALQACKKGEECLKENAALSCLEEILVIEISCMGKLGLDEECGEKKKQKNALVFVYENFGQHRIHNDIVRLLLTSMQSEIMISNEMIREIRKEQRISQEELGADVCTQETLSRIENGRSSPSKNNFQRLLKKMGMEKELFSGFIITEHYEVMEKAGKYYRLAAEEELVESAALLEEVREKIDLSIPENRQYIAACDLIRRRINGIICEEDILSEAKEILCYTMKNFDSSIKRTPTRGELIVINQMAASMKGLGRYEEAEALYEEVLEKFYRSRVLEQHHAMSMMLLYFNYEAVLIDKNDLKKALCIGEKGIEIVLKCERGDLLGKFLEKTAYIYEKTNFEENKEWSRELRKNGCQLMKLMGRDKDYGVAKEHYDAKYGKGIE